jgi:adenine-specific DNA methylase
VGSILLRCNQYEGEFVSEMTKGIVHRYEATPLFTSAGLLPPPPPRTRYQGSKYKLLEWIWQHLSNLKFVTALDAFGGSACVSHFLKAQGKAVTYNDVLISNYYIGQALVANDNDTLNSSDVSFLLTKHKGCQYDDFIERTFHDIYFTDFENSWLDVVAQNIPKLRNLNKRAIAYYALFQAAISKRPYNLFHRKNLYIRTSDVDRSFGNKTTWDKPFAEHFKAFVNEANSCVFSGEYECKAFNMDAMAVPGQYDLVYIDTPYINRKGSGINYYEFYHFLEGLVNYHNWKEKIDFRSKHKRLKPVKSPWNDKKFIYSEFQKLFNRFADSILVVSYRSDGIPTPEEIVGMMTNVKKRVSLYSLNGKYKYVLSKNNKSTEILIIGED